MTRNERIAALAWRIAQLEAKQQAMEALFVHIASIAMGGVPQEQCLRLIAAFRTGIRVEPIKDTADSEFFELIVEEEINRLADALQRTIATT